MIPSTIVKAAQAADLQDLLNHIAWTDVILPQLDSARKLLTEQLVALVLAPPTDKPRESQEQIAGKLYGIDFITKKLSQILREGARAKEDLASQNIFLQ